MIRLYLDIDGLLLTKRNVKAAAFGPEFIDDPKSIAKLWCVKATDWQTLKTEGIAFSSRFYWLDDAPFESEKAHLARNGASERLILK